MPVERKDRDMLLAIAEDLATKSMAKNGDVMACFVALTESGQLAIVPTPWRGEEEKVAMLASVREVFREQKVVAYVSFAEAWIATAIPGDDRPPSEREDRAEVLFIGLAVKGEPQPECRQFKIERPYDGSAPSLVPEPLPPGLTIAGRLTSLLED